MNTEALLKELEEGLEEAFRLAEVGEFLYDACSYAYGNGHDEPREYGIEWQWQQSKPDEYGQGQLLAAATKWHSDQAEDGFATEASKLRALISLIREERSAREKAERDRDEARAARHDAAKNKAALSNDRVLRDLYSELRAAEARATAAESELARLRGELAGGWRTMESAPKDGTDIILGAWDQAFNDQPVDPRVTVGHWTTDEECREEIGDCGGECRCPEYKYHDPYWMSWDGGFTEENPPNGWRPLPAPPAAIEPAPAQETKHG